MIVCSRAVLSFAVVVCHGACSHPDLESAERISTYRRVFDDHSPPALELIDPSGAHREIDRQLGIEVLSVPADAVVAKDVMASLRSVRSTLERLLGPPCPFSLVLASGRPPWTSVHLVTFGTDARWARFTMPVSAGALSDFERRAIVRKMTHEWVEWTVVYGGAEGLYVTDPNNRWVGDGVAEYCTLQVIRQLEGQAAVQDMLDRHLATLEEYRARVGADYRLAGWVAGDASGSLRPEASLDEGLVERAGYGVALALWSDVVEGSGEGLLAEFVAERRLWASKRADSRSIAGWLAERSSVDLPSALQGLLIDDVVRSLRRARADARK